MSVAENQPWKQWLDTAMEKGKEGDCPWVGWTPDKSNPAEKPWLDWVKYYVYPEDIFKEDSTLFTEITDEAWEDACKKDEERGGLCGSNLRSSSPSTAAEGG